VVLAAAGDVIANEVLSTATGAIGLAWLIPVIPALGFLLVLIAQRWLGARAAYVGVAAAGLALLLSVLVALEVRATPATHVRPMPSWIEVGTLSVGFDLLIDQLTVVMLLVVTGVGFLVHVYSVGYMLGDQRFARFFAYLNLFLASMLVLVLGSNLLTLFLGWELVGLSSYLLIGFWFEKREYATAAKKAFITNRVGDVAFMIAMFLAFATLGTLDILEINAAAPALTRTVAFTLVLLLLGGAAAKSAQIPLYVWLPDAMAGPTPVSALIHAATMVTAGVYLTVRMSPVLVQSVDAMGIIAIIGASTALLAALIAVRQNDIKKVLAYSTVSQLGYMFIGVGVGAFREGIFHLVTHAFFKGLLFLAAGSVMHAMANQTDLWRMGGLRRALPITFATSTIAWLAISGVPPFAGFFSKDQILTEAYLHGYGGVYLAGLIGAVITAFYMTRWYVMIFFGAPRYSDDVHPHESPSSMTVPLIILAVASAFGGLILNPVHSGPFLRFLAPVTADISGLGYTPVGPLGEPQLIAISIVAVTIGILLAWSLYGRRDLSGGQLVDPIRGPLAELAERKFLVDEAYEAVLVTGGTRLARALTWFDRRIIDGLVMGSGSAAFATGRLVRRAQTGPVRGAVVVMVVALALLLLAAVWTVA
jgi:NADH-quinone oxidoreductase subunit L